MKKIIIECLSPNSFNIKTDDQKSQAGSLIELKNIIVGLMDQGFVFLEIDLKGIQYPNSSLIGKILYLYHKTIQMDGKIILKNLSPEVKETFNLLKLNELLKI